MLVPEDCAFRIWTVLREIASLEEDGTPKPPEEIRTDPVEVYVQEYAEGFAFEYNEYAKEGFVGEGSVEQAINGSEDSSILETYLNNTESPKDINEFAQVLANYWATVKLEPGDAAVRDEVISVENDASTRVNEFFNAIQASIVTDGQERKPYYEEFIKNIENMAVKTIIWTIVEQDSNGTTTFLQNII